MVYCNAVAQRWKFTVLVLNSMQMLANAQQYVSMLTAETYTFRNGMKNNHPAHSQNNIIVIIVVIIVSIARIKPLDLHTYLHLKMVAFTWTWISQFRSVFFHLILEKLLRISGTWFWARRFSCYPDSSIKMLNDGVQTANHVRNSGVLKSQTLKAAPENEFLMSLKSSNTRCSSHAMYYWQVWYRKSSLAKFSQPSTLSLQGH